MTPITDTAMLKHHRVDYGPKIDTEGARRRTGSGRAIGVFMTAVVAVNLAAVFLG